VLRGRDEHERKGDETMKTMTGPQMAWAVKNGFAWADADNDTAYCLAEIFYTADDTYGWDPNRQLYITT
jgi:hypothetical protein